MARVLVVDDDIKLLNAVQIRLESMGHEVAIAQDAYHALAKTVRSHPDLLVLDVNLPAGNGPGIERRLNELEGFGDIPVIYITGETPETFEQLVGNSESKTVLYKPFSSTDLVCSVKEKIEDILTNNKRYEIGL